MKTPFPDGYVVDDMLAFAAPAGGAFSAGWFLELPDLQTAPFAEQNRAQDALVAILHQLPEGWRAAVQWWEDHDYRDRLLTYQEQTEHATQPATRFIRNANFLDLHQRLLRGELRRKRLAIFVGRTLSGSSAPWNRKKAVRQHAQQLEQAATGFAEWEQTLNHALEGIGGRALRMGDADLIRRWAETLNPSFVDRLKFDPTRHFDSRRTLLDNCWHSELRAHRHGFVLDGWHHLALTVKRLPSETFPTISHRLTRLPFGGFTITADLRRLSRDAVIARAQRELDRVIQQLARKPDERLAVTRAQLEDKIRRLASGEVIPLEVEIVIIIRAKSLEELNNRAAAIKAAIHDMNGGQYYEATLPATTRNLFAKALPGWHWSTHRGFALYGESRYVADMLLMSGSWPGHPGPVESLFPGPDGNLVNIVTFLGEGRDATPQNLIVLGAVGTGKSLTLNKVLRETQLNYQYTTLIEEGLSHALYTRGFGAEPIVVRLDGAQTLNGFDTHGLPLSTFHRSSLTAVFARMAGIPADEDKARRRSALIAQHVARLCEDHVQDRLRGWRPEQRDALVRHALVLDHWAHEHRVSAFDAFLDFRDFQRERADEAQARLARCSESDLREFESQHPTQVHDLAFAYFQPEEHLTLSAFREYLELAEEDVEECRWLAVLLTPWCRGGNCGVLFDGVNNVTLDGPDTHFELGCLPESARDIKAVVGFQIINSQRQHILSLPRHWRKRIVIEEVSRFLDIPGAETILRELFEQFRKFNCQVTIVAQSYSRIADTPIRTALVGNTRAWMIFNTGSREDVERLGRDIGLSQLAQDTILRLPRPDQLTGTKYSEFLYYHSAPGTPICGPVRYFRLPDPQLPFPQSSTKP